MTNSLSIVATGLPKTLEDYQLALNAAFEGGRIYGKLKEQQSLINFCYKMSDDYGKAGLPMAYCAFKLTAEDIKKGLHYETNNV